MASSSSFGPDSAPFSYSEPLLEAGELQPSTTLNPSTTDPSSIDSSPGIPAQAQENKQASKQRKKRQTPATQPKRPRYQMLDPILQPANNAIARDLMIPGEVLVQDSNRIPEATRPDLKHLHRVLKDLDRKWQELDGYGEDNEWVLARIGGWSGGSFTEYFHGSEDVFLRDGMVHLRVLMNGQYVVRHASNRDAGYFRPR